MKVIKRFMADDGTIFDNEEVCREYEKRLIATWDKYSKEVFLYGKDGEELSFTKEDYAKCYYLKVLTDEAAKFLEEQLSEDYIIPWSDKDECCTGIWALGPNFDWKDITFLFDKGF